MHQKIKTITPNGPAQDLKLGKETMKKLNFSDFANTCKIIANNLHTMVEVKDYSQYGFGKVAFMTDKFGGTYVFLHFDMETGHITNWYGHPEAREINDLSFLSYFVKSEMEKMLKSRDLEEISDRINTEY